MLAFKLAGFLTAQVCGVMSDAPMNTVTPVAFVVTGSNQQFRFFEGISLEEMVINGRRELEAGRYDAWAFAYEGYAVVQGRRRLALFVESQTASPAKRTALIQFMTRSHNGVVSLIGDPLKLANGTVPTAERVIRAQPEELSAQERSAFDDGMARQREFKAKGYIGSQ
jgi:hypothetical protein